MTKTFKELREIDNIVSDLYKKNESLKDTKFGYAYKRFLEKNYVPSAKEYNSELETVRIDNALEDEKTKQILQDPTNIRGFKYSKAGLKKVIEEENKIVKAWDEKPIEVVPFISAFVPENLTEEEREVLTGILI